MSHSHGQARIHPGFDSLNSFEPPPSLSEKTRGYLMADVLSEWSLPHRVLPHAAPHAAPHVEAHAEPDAEHHAHKARRVEANAYILDMCKKHVDQKLGAPPPWIQNDYKDPPPTLQCASTASNIYRMVLKESHCIAPSDSKSYRWLDQVSVRKFVHAMEDSGLAREIPRSEVRPGDCVIGESDLHRARGNSNRHIGFVGNRLDHHGGHDMVAYSNAAGHFRKQELNDRFGHYKHEYFLRLYLPKFHKQES